MYLRTRVLLTMTAALAVGSLTAFGGTITTYTNRALWEAAISSESTIDFETSSGTYTAAPSGSLAFEPKNGFTIDGTSFLDVIGTNSVIYSVNAAGSYADYGTHTALATQLSGGASSYTAISLVPGTQAWGIDLGTGNDSTKSSRQLTIDYGSATQSITTSVSNLVFFGIISDVALSNPKIYRLGLPGGGTNVATILDNFSTGTPGGGGGTGGDAPEAGTLLLCGGGLIVLAKKGRRLMPQFS